MYIDTLQNRLRFKWADNGSGHTGDYTADLIQAADTIDALQNTVSQLEKDNEWQTMETAPRDGTNILLFSKHGVVYVASYDADFKAPWRVINEFGFVEHVFLLWRNCPADPDLMGF